MKTWDELSKRNLNRLQIMLAVFWISLILPSYIEDKTVFYSCIGISIVSSIYLIVHLAFLIVQQMKDFKKED
jgi:hypothetical protein